MIFLPLLAKCCCRGISIKFDVNWQLRHKLKNLLCSLFIQLHIAHIYLTFAVYSLHTINARDIYLSTRTICSRARAETFCGGGFVLGGRWQPKSSRTKQIPFCKSIKEILANTQNCFSDIFNEQKHFNLCDKKLKNRYN